MWRCSLSQRCRWLASVLGGWALATTAGLTAGCAREAPEALAGVPADARPREPEAAAYELRGDAGTTGRARVWSEGLDPAHPAALDVTIAVANAGPLPIDIAIEGARIEGRPATIAGRRPERVLRGQATVGPGGTERIQAVFLLPAAVDPRQVSRFEVTWRTAIAADERLWSTPFVRAPSRPSAGGEQAVPFVPAPPEAGD